MDKIKIDDLAKTVMRGLEDYKDIMADDLKESLKETADFVKKEIQDTAPKKTGEYAKSWKVKKGLETANSAEFTIYSEKPHLPHLLEFGHQTRNGGRTRAFPHIEPAEKKGIEYLDKKLKSKIGG